MGTTKLSTDFRSANFDSSPSKRPVLRRPVEPRLQFGAYEGQVQLHGFPNDLKVDLPVIVDDPIAHADDFSEWHRPRTPPLFPT